MKYCAFCGAKLEDDAKFCLKCGEKCIDFIDDNDEAPNPEEEQKRLEAERLEKERQEQERLKAEEAARLEAERLEKERLEKERLEAEERERQRIEEEKRLEAERLEKERLERERLEEERKKAEEEARLEAERLEKERLERERLEQEKAKLLEEKRLEEERQKKAAESNRNKELEDEIEALRAELASMKKGEPSPAEPKKAEKPTGTKKELVWIPILAFFLGLAFSLGFFFPKDTFGSMTSAIFGIGLVISGFVFVGSIVLLCLPKLGKATKWLAVVNIIASLAFVGLIVVTYLTEVPGGF